MALDDTVREWRQYVPSKRVDVGTPGQLGFELQRIMADYLDARGRGLSFDEGVAGIERALRDLWPQRPTQFPATCDRCDDTGFERVQCDHYHRCGRLFCGRAHPSHEHAYVVPCSCASGDRHRHKPAQPDDYDVQNSRGRKPRWRK